MAEPRDLQIASASRSIPRPVTNGGGSGGFLVAERLDSRRNAALTAMIATDREGLVTQLDSGAEQLIQASAASILGRALVDVFQIADEDRSWFFGGESNSEDAKHKRFPCRVCDAVGQAHHASWSRLALQDASGNVESIVFTAVCQPHARPESPAATPWCFLEDGDRTKVTLRFRGREMAHQELGMELLQRVKVDLEEYGTVEQEPKMEGRLMVMVLAPKRNR